MEGNSRVSKPFGPVQNQRRASERASARAPGMTVMTARARVRCARCALSLHAGECVGGRANKMREGEREVSTSAQGVR